jgi:hypothetical protein
MLIIDSDLLKLLHPEAQEEVVILSEAKDLYVQRDPSFRFASLRMTTFCVSVSQR